MTNTNHKDSTNSYTNTNTATSEYSFEDLPHEKTVTLLGLVYVLITVILEVFIGLLMFAVNILLFLSPFILVGLGIYYLFFFN